MWGLIVFGTISSCQQNRIDLTGSRAARFEVVRKIHSENPLENESHADKCARVLAECSDRMSRGEEVEVEVVLAKHSDLGSELGEALRGLLELPSAEERRPPFEKIGDYKLLREAGRGGMGVVYEAWQVSMERRVAVKVLPANLLGDERAVARFKREAKVASRLDHPGICTVFEAGVKTGVPYIAMRYIEGETLARKLSKARVTDSTCVSVATENGSNSRIVTRDACAQASTATPAGSANRADIMTVLHLMERVARALHVAHEAGFVHRDIKPSNIMITSEGDPVLLDFGLARGEDDATRVTRAGEILGTLHYMSPEQIVTPARETQRSQVDRRTDVYSLGVTLYECVTLRLPFYAETTEGLLRKIRYSDPPNPRHINRRVPKELKTILEASLEKDPGRRYATALDLAEDLRRVRNHEPIQARATSRVLRLRRWTQRNPVVATVIICLLFFLATTFGLFLWAREGWRRTKEAENRLTTLHHWVTDEGGEHFSSKARAKRAGRTFPVVPESGAFRLSFAVYTSDDARKMYEKFDPILAHLERTVSNDLGMRVLIDLYIFHSYDRAKEALVRGIVDFVRFGPTSYILAKRENPGISLLAIEEEHRPGWKHGSRLFSGVIFTREGSGIERLEDLKGRSFAFVDENSTIGSHLSKAFLSDHGIFSRDLAGSRYLGSHDRACEAVLAGESDAAAVKEGTFDNYKEEPPGLKVIARLLNVTKPWVARKGLRSEMPRVVEAIEKSLLALDDRRILGALGEKLTGFGRVEDDEYHFVRRAMEKAERFGPVGESLSVDSEASGRALEPASAGN